MIDRLQKEVDMVERHLQVLRLVVENEPMGIVKLSEETGFPHHKVRYSLRVLEEESLIEPSNRGALTTDQTRLFIDGLADDLEELADQLQSLKFQEVEVKS